MNHNQHDCCWNARQVGGRTFLSLLVYLFVRSLFVFLFFFILLLFRISILYCIDSFCYLVNTSTGPTGFERIDDDIK